MKRYRSTYDQDEPEVTVGDQAFVGVNMRLAPSSLPDGFVSEAKNVRFNRGRIESRKGMLKLPWSNRWVTDQVQPFDRIFGIGVFRDPDDVEWVLIAAHNYVYATREASMAKLVPLPAGVAINEPVVFVQAMGELLMFRGESFPVLRLTDIDEGFLDVPMRDNTITNPGSENPWDGTERIPNASTAVYMQNRLFVPYDRDLVAVSDFLNYTRYQPQISVFRINQGSPDRLVALAKCGETSLISFKEGSIYRVSNVYGDLSEARLDEVTRQYGCKAPRSIVPVGNDVWFLADRRGISSITLTEQGEVQAVDLPVSDAIQPLIDRINWPLAHNACAGVNDNQFFMAVPIDESIMTSSNLVPVGAEYGDDGEYSLTVKAGQTYHFTPGSPEETLYDGFNTLTAAQDFVAEEDVVFLRKDVPLFSDDFEDEGSQWVENYDAFTKWDVLYSEVDLINAGYPGMGIEGFAPEEGNYIDLKGTWPEGSTEGAIIRNKAAISLETAVDYVLKLKVAGSQRQCIADVVVQIVDATTDAVVYEYSIWNIPAEQGFEQYNYEFTAAADQDVKIKIQCGQTGQDNIGALLAEVSLVKLAGGSEPGPILSTVVQQTEGFNNAVFVYSFLNQAWSGYDVGTTACPLMIQEWFEHTYQGVRRLFAATNDGYLNLYEEGAEDELSDASGVMPTPIETEVLTRGYSVGIQERKRWKEFLLNISSWAPRFSISQVMDSEAERALLTDKTKSRTRYIKPFNRAPWVSTNVNDDHGTNDREDYSVLLVNEATEIAPGTNGIDCERMSEYPVRYRCAGVGRVAQFRISNDQGRLIIHGLEVSASPGPRTGGESV